MSEKRQRRAGAVFHFDLIPHRPAAVLGFSYQDFPPYDVPVLKSFHFQNRIDTIFSYSKDFLLKILSLWGIHSADQLMKTDDDNPTIGLLICKDKDQTEVKWAFQGIETPMGVATYDNIRMNEIKSQLPSEEAIP